MKNKELKKQLIENDSFKDYREQRFYYFKNQNYDMVDSSIYFHGTSGEMFTEEEIIACSELKEARKKQVSKIRKHYIYWLNNEYDIFFCTFTYDDKKRKKEMKIETLKKYCIRALENFDDFIINVDYGRENERLHFHALGAIRKNKQKAYIPITRKTKEGKYKKGVKLVNYELLEYERKVGFYDCEPCKDNVSSAKKLSRYIDKLTLHSIKVKQNYVSVKKGSEYQKEQQYIRAYNEQLKNIKKRHQGIYINDYIKAHNQNKGLLRVEKRVNIEYELLNKRRTMKENYLKLQQIKIEKNRENRLF